MSYLWETKNLVTKLEKLGLNTSVYPPGGDYDTSQINAEGVCITGFTPNQFLSESQRDFNKVDFIEVTDGLDSRGGLNSNDPKVIKAYSEINRFLRGEIAGTGTTLINHYSEVF